LIQAQLSMRVVWRPGLRFEDFAAGKLDLETSKTDTQAVFDVTVYPLFQQALPAVPDAAGGTACSVEHACPARRRNGSAAGRCRPCGLAEHAQHADINTARKHYIVPSVETSRRLAEQRVAHRQAKKNTP
jgi:hypothetical protein